MLLCILLQTKYSQLHKDNIVLIENPVFKELLPCIEVIMAFQQTTLNKNLKSLSDSDVKKLLKYGQGIKNHVSML